jgi:hypothetical protein
VQRAARASLTRLSGDVNLALVRMLANIDAAQRAEACRALAGRRATMAVGELMKLTKANEAEVRRAAIAAVGDLAGEGDLPALVALMVSPKEPGDRTAIDQAIKTAFRGIADPKRRSAPVLAAAQNASGEAKAALLRLLVNAPTEAGLKLALAALKDTDATVRDAAVRTLSDWPVADPADQLLAIARTAENPTHQVLAMRGYIRMAGLTPDPTVAYVRAMELAQRADDRKLVLAGLGSASTPAALDLIEKQLADPATRAEAALAAVQVATRLKEADAPRARKALQAVTVAISEPAIRQKALDVLNDMDKFEGHIRAWVVSEMFQEKNKDGKAAFDAVYAPEKGEASAIQWKPLRRGIGSWGDINLEAMFGTQDYCAAYVRTRIWSPAGQDARLEMGSDDALKAWLNGSLVHGKYQNRGLDPRQDIVPVKLKEGWNDLMLKVVDHEGGWNFCCRIRKPDGTALDGLKVEP